MADGVPTPPYTEATREVAARAIHAVRTETQDHPERADELWEYPVYRKAARASAEAALDALVKAGLLLPEGAETRTGPKAEAKPSNPNDPGIPLQAWHAAWRVYTVAGHSVREAIKSAYWAGRAQAASDIRDHPGPDPSPASPTWWAGYSEALRDAVRLAEGDSSKGAAVGGGEADLSKDHR